MGKYRNKILIGLAVLVILIFVYWWGGDAPGLRGWQPSESSVAEQQQSEKDNQNPIKENSAEKENLIETDDPREEAPTSPVAEQPSSSGVEEGSTEYSKEKGMVLDEATGKDKYLTDPVPEGKPLPVEPEEAKIKNTAYTATLSVRCDTILDNMDWLDPEKIELVPEDGVIFPATQVTFYEGESVFNLLQREMKQNKIHLEFKNTPMYNSAYIRGINNLYEFDVGEISGWMYKVNGWFPNYGVSRYQLEDGDVVEFVYTCDLGLDVGGHFAVGE